MEQKYFVTPYEFGAIGDSFANDTAAVQKALDVSDAEGVRCLLAKGCFVCGTLYLKSGATLEVAANGILKASPDPADFAADTHHNRYRNEPDIDRCFLYADDTRNITLCGISAFLPFSPMSVRPYSPKAVS